ncbi:unnamed protein product [Trifolium pratense]|uniref:Uncharacterized protein n=1 Tax=Trifolium pratense TaxID=57577 RepID=A0ACB0L7A9_TRIPR|nr:unnamed protein product [Trifolium pratense]
MGIYAMMGAFTYQERNRRSNVMPITLGPHGANFVNVCKALASNFRDIEKGKILEIKGKKILCIIFNHVFIGDMPQQQQNAGCKSQRANLGCLFCFVTAEERQCLNYEIIDKGRTHYQHIQMRQQLHHLNKRDQDSYAKRFGISIEPLALQPLSPLSPALDLLLSNPPDPAHSEYSGITRLMHEILLENILTQLAVRLYHLQLRQFPFSPGYARLQSPIHHLKSYNMSDHARWSMVIAPLLRVWLRVNHFKPNFIRALRSNFGPSRTNPNDTEAVNEIDQAFASLAKSLVNAIIANSVPATSEVAEMNSRTQSSKAGKILIKKEALPNVHIALHYPDIAEEYGLPLMIHGLRDAGKSHKEIANQLKISLRQVGYALLRGNVTPKKRKGRSPIPSSEDVDQIENFVKSSPLNRRMTYLKLAAGPFRHFGVSEKVRKKVPVYFGRKNGGTIDSENYCQKIVPLIDGMVSMRPWLSVMQDNAPPHAAARTMEEMGDRVITPISWPPNSPDLNPIEAVWDNMKNYIQLNYPSLGSGRKTIPR